MKKTAILLLVFSMISLSSCDMFRKLAGRPTSEDLQQMKIDIEKFEAEREALKLRQKRTIDSLAIINALREAKHKIRTAGELNGIDTTLLSSKYYIVIGTFQKKYNVDVMLRRIGATSYKAVAIEFAKGTYVAVCPSENIFELYRNFELVKKEDFCPPDAWILINE